MPGLPWGVAAAVGGMDTSQVALWCRRASSRLCSAPAHHHTAPSFSHPSAPNSAASRDTQLCLRLWLWSIHVRQKNTHTQRSYTLWVKGVLHYGQQGSQTWLHLLSWREGYGSLRKWSWWFCLDTISPFTNQNSRFCVTTWSKLPEGHCTCNFFHFLWKTLFPAPGTKANSCRQEKELSTAALWAQKSLTKGSEWGETQGCPEKMCKCLP